MQGSTKGNLQCSYPSLSLTNELELGEALWNLPVHCAQAGCNTWLCHKSNCPSPFLGADRVPSFTVAGNGDLVSLKAFPPYFDSKGSLHMRVGRGSSTVPCKLPIMSGFVPWLCTMLNTSWWILNLSQDTAEGKPSVISSAHPPSLSCFFQVISVSFQGIFYETSRIPVTWHICTLSGGSNLDIFIFRWLCKVHFQILHLDSISFLYWERISFVKSISESIFAKAVFTMREE